MFLIGSVRILNWKFMKIGMSQVTWPFELIIVCTTIKIVHDLGSRIAKFHRQSKMIFREKDYIKIAINFVFQCYATIPRSTLSSNPRAGSPHKSVATSSSDTSRSRPRPSRRPTSSGFTSSRKAAQTWLGRGMFLLPSTQVRIMRVNRINLPCRW